MEIVYKFVIGEKVTVDFNAKVDEKFRDELYTIIFEMDEEWRKSDRREDNPERHDSLSDFNDKFKFVENTHSPSVSEQVLKNFDKDKLQNAVTKLKPKEQELLRVLYLNKNPITQVELAKIQNVSVGSIKMKLQRIKAKLKKLL